MSVPNIGPELPDPTTPEAMDSVRRGNPASAYRDDGPTDDVKAAAIRASAAGHRFAGAPHRLSRPKNQQAGESDPGK